MGLFGLPEAIEVADSKAKPFRQASRLMEDQDQDDPLTFGTLSARLADRESLAGSFLMALVVHAVKNFCVPVLWRVMATIVRVCRIVWRGMVWNFVASGFGSEEFVTRLVDQSARDLPPEAREPIEKVCTRESILMEILRSGIRRRNLSVVHRESAIVLLDQMGLTLAEVARQLGMSTSPMAHIVRRENQK